MRNRLVVATVLVAAGLLGVSVSRVSADPALTLSAPARPTWARVPRAPRSAAPSGR